MIASKGQTCDGGNRTLRWSQFCDGIVDCRDRSDEEGQFCRQCINNLYSCPPQDDIRCDLACQMLHYVPCQTIQDRRACLMLRNDQNYSPFYLLKDWNFYLAVAIATFVVLLLLTGITFLSKYLLHHYRQRKLNSLAKMNFVRPNAPPAPPPYLSTPQAAMEHDYLTSHLYEQCYDPPSYEAARKYPGTRVYYEHAL